MMHACRTRSLRHEIPILSLVSLGREYLCRQLGMELIPNLPNEIAVECLVRLPHKSHHNLKGVCRSWRWIINSPWFYEQRKTRGTAEQCIFMLKKQKKSPVYGVTYDPVQGGWNRIPSIPELANSVPLFSRCVSVKGKLILIGGWHPSNLHPINSVFIYDVVSARWTRGADMPTLRSPFGCCISGEGMIYVAGGHDEDKNALKTVEVYNAEKDEWESVPAMSKGRDECEAVWTEGQLMVISGFQTDSQWRFHSSAEVFHPPTRTWRVVENMWGSDECARSSVVAGVGGLYHFSKQGVMQYKSTENSWMKVESMPEGIRVAPCATVWRDKIFVSGSGGGDTMCYMFDPRNGIWVAVKRPRDIQGFVQCATSLEI